MMTPFPYESSHPLRRGPASPAFRSHTSHRRHRRRYTQPMTPSCSTETLGSRHRTSHIHHLCRGRLTSHQIVSLPCTTLSSSYTRRRSQEYSSVLHKPIFTLPAQSHTSHRAHNPFIAQSPLQIPRHLKATRHRLQSLSVERFGQRHQLSKGLIHQSNTTKAPSGLTFTQYASITTTLQSGIAQVEPVLQAAAGTSQNQHSSLPSHLKRALLSNQEVNQILLKADKPSFQVLKHSGCRRKFS